MRDTRAESGVGVGALVGPTDLIVGEIMSVPPVFVLPTSAAPSAEALARDRGVRRLFVGTPSYCVGVVCVCELWWCPPEESVSDRLRSPPLTISVVASLAEAAEVMRARDVGCLAVVSGGLVCGALTRNDLKRAGVFNENEPDRRCLSCRGRRHLRHVGGENDDYICMECLCGRSPEDLATALESVEIVVAASRREGSA